MSINVYKFTPIFVDNTSVVLNATNTDSTLNKKTVTLRYDLFREHGSNNLVEVRKVHTSNNFAESFTKTPVINDFHGFYHACMFNG